MNGKRAITKEEAQILLQSQPLSANLWQLASDRLQEQAIRFPDPSFLDSQSWPEYFHLNPATQKPEQPKTIEQKNVSVETEQTPIRLQPIEETHSDMEEMENSISVDQVTEFTEEIISIRIVETEIPETKKKAPSKRKLKKESLEIKSPDLVNENKIQLAESLDFYEWLEELKDTREHILKQHKKAEAKSKLNKEAIELEEAKIMAENSLKLGDEIVSETLARLLARQGHKQEAIEMYQKLILKYPEKGTTFAAALQKLKS